MTAIKTTIDPAPAPTARFRYVARNTEGKRVRGTVEARSRRGARMALLGQGLEPIRVREKTGLNVELRPAKVKQAELMHFSRQLAAFARAGVPILEAIDGLADGTDNKTFKKALYEVNDALRAGESLTDALREHPRVFPPYYQTAVRAAEQTGRLDQTLDRLAEYLERDIENRRKVISAFTYPSVIFVFAIIVVIVLTIFVMPRFQGLFAALGAQLPMPTRLLIGIMAFFTHWGWLLLVIVAAAGVAVAAGRRTRRGKALLDRVVLKLPAIGLLVRTAIIERFCRALGSMVEAAVPLPEALEIAAEGTNNVVFSTGVSKARAEMLEGEGIADPLAASGLFPVAALQMVRAGEQTGTLERQLMNTADFYEKELDYRLKRFTTLFEPAVILFAGLIVGFVAVAVVSAMYGMLTDIPL